MTGAVRLLAGADAPELRSLLGADPVAYAMVTERTQMVGVGTALGAEVWGWFPDGNLEAALYMGANVVPIEADKPAARAFAQRARLTPRRCSSIVGPSDAVLTFHDGVAETWGQPREVRPRQPLLAIAAEPQVVPDPRVRAATADEVDLLFPASVAMFTEELGVSPIGSDAGAAYRRRVATLVRQGRAFVLIENDRVLFKAEVGVAAGEVAQIQGVWVDPAYRGRGLSAPALAAVVQLCRQRFAATVSLYVNDFNAPALAAYDRVGFQRVGEFATVLY